MKRVGLFLIVCFVSVFFQQTSAQVASTSIFDAQIHSLQVFKGDWEWHFPILELESDEVLSIQFDDFSQPQNTFTYSISFCNADWTPSDLMKSDYLSGFDEQLISDYRFSSNTTKQYAHYELNLPNDDVQFLIPGNYLLTVYKNNEPDSVVFTQQLWVISQILSVDASVSKPMDATKLLTHQHINVEVTDMQNQVRDAYLDLRIVLMQNFRPDRQNVLSSPAYIQGNKYIYKNTPENLFPGGTEFLHFDTKNIRFKEMNTDSIAFDGQFYHFYTRLEEVLPYKPYSSAEDINGNYRVQLENESHRHLLADYVYVHLFLENNKYIMNSPMFAGGQFNLWKKNITAQYQWNSEARAFENVLFVKQGYYNYIIENEFSETVLSPVENHAETENDYFIFVYLKDKTLNFDKLAGFLRINSIRNAN